MCVYKYRRSVLHIGVAYRTCTYIHIYIFIHTYMHAYIFIYNIHACKYLCVCIYIHIHIHTVLDMWMLASADDLVITPSSTYGMMGAALNPARASPEFARSGKPLCCSLAKPLCCCATKPLQPR